MPTKPVVKNMGQYIIQVMRLRPPPRHEAGLHLFESLYLCVLNQSYIISLVYYRDFPVGYVHQLKIVKLLKLGHCWG